MSFTISKLLWCLLQPSSLMLALLGAGAVACRRGNLSWARRIVTTVALLYLLFGWLPFGNWIAIPLEDRFVRPDFAQIEDVSGIIVLGGAIETVVSRARGVATLNEAGERMTESAALAKRLPKARLIFSGGSAELLYASMSESDVARALYESMGLPSGRLEFEDRSRTTAENARFTRALVAPAPGPVPGRWLLVTSAYHLPRAMGVFRAQGFDVLPWPVDYRTRGPEDAWRLFDKPSEGLRRVDIMAHEWVALASYRATGQTDAVFPGP